MTYIQTKENFMDAELISELVEGQNLFDSKGYSIIKVTKAGEEKFLKLPIKSTGVAEFQESLSGKAPRPPVTFEVIKKGSPEGRALSLTHDRLIHIFDTTDEKYVDALNKHNQEFSWQVVVFAVDVEWKKKDGTLCQSYEEKKAILKSNGITGEHVSQIFKDVQRLTTLQGDQEDFLAGN